MTARTVLSERILNAWILAGRQHSHPGPMDAAVGETMIFDKTRKRAARSDACQVGVTVHCGDEWRNGSGSRPTLSCLLRPFGDKPLRETHLYLHRLRRVGIQ